MHMNRKFTKAHYFRESTEQTIHESYRIWSGSSEEQKLNSDAVRWPVLCRAPRKQTLSHIKASSLSSALQLSLSLIQSPSPSPHSLSLPSPSSGGAGPQDQPLTDRLLTYSSFLKYSINSSIISERLWWSHEILRFR